MLVSTKKYLFLILITVLATACRKPFEPAALIARNNYLVVDAIINTGVNAITTVKLSRTRNLSDTTYDILPESGAVINIEGKDGSTYPLQQTSSLAYNSSPLNLSTSQTYRLHITTANGEQYLSDYVAVKQSPPIDSITWQRDSGVTIFANTHDITNNTKYYRWDFTETWQHDAAYQATMGVNNNLIYYLDSTNSIYHCWTDANGTSILLATSSALSQDVIRRAPITTIANGSEKLGIRYSILVRQYALTSDAYAYWSIIQKNTQSIGSLFDLQPSQLHGNIASVSNKTEPVIGFVSAGSVQEKRIFINYADLAGWNVPPSQQNCDIKKIPQDPQNFLVYNYPDTSYAPYYFITPGIIAIAKKVCLDCRYQGGTNIKPSYW